MPPSTSYHTSTFRGHAKPLLRPIRRKGDLPRIQQPQRQASAGRGGDLAPSTSGNGDSPEERKAFSSSSAAFMSTDGSAPGTASPHPTVIMSRGEYLRHPQVPPGYEDPSMSTSGVRSNAGLPSSPNGAAQQLGRNIPADADKKLITTTINNVNNPAKTTGLRRAPLSGGVKTATDRWALPSPPVAVRNLVEQANFAHLCTVMSDMHHRRAGYPFGTLVDFASDGAGLPIFCLSPLAIHARNIIEDSRCSLVVQMPGWTGLANARVTIFGDIYQLPQSMQDDAREIFLRKHLTQRKERWVTGNFLYFRMHRIVDIYFVGGFGTVQWIDPLEYTSCQPDTVVLNDPHTTLQVLNETFAEDLRHLCYPGNPADDAAVISIDAAGAEVRVRHGAELTVERIGFETKVNTREEAVAAVRAVITKL